MIFITKAITEEWRFRRRISNEEGFEECVLWHLRRIPPKHGKKDNREFWCVAREISKQQVPLGVDH